MVVADVAVVPADVGVVTTSFKPGGIDDPLARCTAVETCVVPSVGRVPGGRLWTGVWVVIGVGGCVCAGVGSCCDCESLLEDDCETVRLSCLVKNGDEYIGDGPL